MEKERKYQHAFVKYTKQGKLVSGSLIIARNHPKDGGVWVEVTESICCEPDCDCVANGDKHAYIRFANDGHVVPGSMLITPYCPPEIGCWKEIPVDICCQQKYCETTTTTTTEAPPSIYYYGADAIFLGCNGQTIDPFVSTTFSISSTVSLTGISSNNVFLIPDYPTPGFNGCWQLFSFFPYPQGDPTYPAIQKIDCNDCTN